jgi:hypothetical protein
VLVSFWVASASMPQGLAGTLLKWVDKEGRVHYGDNLPPSAAPLDREVLNRQAVPIESIHPEKPRDEEAAGSPELAKARQQAAKQQAYDAVLLKTFATVEDLKALRDRRLGAIDSELRMTVAQSRKLRAQLGYLVAAAADRERRGEAVPKELMEAMEITRSQMTASEAFLSKQKTARAEAAAKYQADLDRLVELGADRQKHGGVKHE